MSTFQTQLQSNEGHSPDYSIANALLRERLLAQEQELEGKTHLKLAAPPTIKNYSRSEKRWRDVDRERCLEWGSPVPSSGRLKNFIAWCAETTNGILGPKPTQVSMKNVLKKFCAMFYRNTGTKIPKVLNEHVCGFIETELLVTHNVKDVIREKDLIDSVDFQQLLEYLWIRDPLDFQHPRYRSQIAFLIQILAYTGARPGTVVVSSAYANDNDSLKYKDFEVLLIHGPDGPELVLKLKLRLAKGRRNFARTASVEGNALSLRSSVWPLQTALFEDINLRQLSYLKIKENTSHLPLKIKDNMLEVPVCRMYSEGIISPLRAMTYNVLRNQANQLGQRLGYQAVLRPYNFRRGTANAITSEVTAEEYTKLLNHTTKTSAEYYASDEVKVDSQNLFLRGAQEMGRLDKLKGMNFYKQSHAPNKLSHLENQKILDDLEYKSLEAIESEILCEVAQAEATKGCVRSMLQKRLSSAISKRKNYYKRAYEKAYKEYRSEFFREVGPREVQRQIQAIEGGGEITLSISDSFADRKHSSKGVAVGYFTAREHIAKAFFRTDIESKRIPDTSVLEALKALSAPEPYVLYYPNEALVDEKCLVCYIEMNSLPQLERALHIHKCYENVTLTKSEIQHFECIATRCLWDSCRRTLTLKPNSSTSTDWPSISHAITLPYDISCSRSSEDKKVNQSQSMLPKQYLAHFQRHLENSHLICQWDGCGQRLSSRFELRRHLLAFHSISTRQSPFHPQFCLQHPSAGWFTCEFAWEDHCEKHLANPQACYDLERRYGTIVVSITCPFCLGSPNPHMPASYRVRQFTNRGRFNVHLENCHYREMKESVNICCPHPLCHGKSIHSDLKDLKVHFYDCHRLPEKGFTAMRGVRLGGRGASKVSSTSDIDQGLKEQLDHDTEQDQNDEFNRAYNKSLGSTSPASDTGQSLNEESSPEFSNNFGIDYEKFTWLGGNEVMDFGGLYPQSSLEISANNWSPPTIDYGIFQYINFSSHNFAAKGLGKGLSPAVTINHQPHAGRY